MDKSVVFCGVSALTLLLVTLRYKVKIAPIFWSLYNWRSKKENHEDEAEMLFRIRKPPDIWNTAIFFPDVDPENENSPTNQLMSYFKNARVSIHMCVYLTSYYPLDELIITKKKEGLVIQVLADCDQVREEGQNWGMTRWKQSGIPVRYNDRTKELMHNKFVIFDDEAILTGSLNWSKQAFLGNHENVVITTRKNIVEAYKAEFNRLWGEANCSL